MTQKTTKLKQKCEYCQKKIPKNTFYYFEKKRLCSNKCFNKYKEIIDMERNPQTGIKRKSWLNSLINNKKASGRL